MSKGNMLLGQARGKVGDLVFSRANGQQIVRSRAAVVRNPQTESQTIQRIILNTISQAYSRMSEITDHSFEGVQSGAKSMNAFMKKNLNLLRTRVADSVAEGNTFDAVYEFSPIGTNTFALNPYLIATGSLPEVVVDEVNGAPNENGGLYIVLDGIESAPTYRQILDTFNLQRGDQLTFCAITGSQVANRGFKYARVILDPRQADGSPADLDVPFISGNAVNLPSPRNEGDITAIYFSAGSLVVSLTDQSHIGGAVIVSRQSTDGTWRRSNSTIVFSVSYLLGYSLQDAIDQFYADTLDLQNDLYLNNARRQSRQSAQQADTISVVTYGQGSSAPGAAVTLVGLSTLEVTNTPEEGSPVTTVVPAAVDVDGHKHVLLCDNEHNHGYGKILGDINGVSIDRAWTIDHSTLTAPTDAKADAVIIWGDTNIPSEDPNLQWLFKQGVSQSVVMPEY